MDKRMNCYNILSIWFYNIQSKDSHFAIPGPIFFFNHIVFQQSNLGLDVVYPLPGGVCHSVIYTFLAGDSMTYSDGMKFSTKDQDNDDDSGQCATYWKSAWWFKSCFYTNPNGQYTDSEKRDWKYVVWYHWKKENFSLKSIKMTIRPKNQTSTEKGLYSLAFNR